MQVTCRGMTGDLVKLVRERKPIGNTSDGFPEYEYFYHIDLYDSEIETTYCIDCVKEEEMFWKFQE